MPPEAVIRFVWRELKSDSDLGVAQVPRALLPVLNKRSDLPLLSSVDEFDPSFFGPPDMLSLELELERVLKEMPGASALEQALALVRACRANPATGVLVTPL